MPQSNLTVLRQALSPQEHKLLALEQERDLWRALALAAQDYIKHNPGDPDIFPEQWEAYIKYLGYIDACHTAGVLPFPGEKSGSDLSEKD